MLGRQRRRSRFRLTDGCFQEREQRAHGFAVITVIGGVAGESAKSLLTGRRRC